MRNPSGSCVTREALLEQVWGYQVLVETNTVDVFISNLRRKLEAGGEPRAAAHGSRQRGTCSRPMRRLAQSFDRLPVRWRLSVTSAGLTFVILLLFAVAAEMVTVSRVRSDFDSSLRLTATQLQSRVAPSGYSNTGGITFNREIIDAAAAGGRDPDRRRLRRADPLHGGHRLRARPGRRARRRPATGWSPSRSSSDGAPIAYLQYAKTGLEPRRHGQPHPLLPPLRRHGRHRAGPARRLHGRPPRDVPGARASPAPPRRSPARATRA